MIDGLRPYPTMKDSGLPWLGTVPEHWDVRRLKYVLRERDSRSSSGAEQLLRVSQYTGVTERRQSVNGDLPETRAESLVGYKIVEPNDLVVNIMLAWNGSMGLSSFAGIASPAYCVYRFKANVQPWYFHHLLRSPPYRARIKAMSTGVVESRLRLYTDDLYRLEGLLPPLLEQTAIVRFLNHVDRLTRRYIRTKQKLIKLLEEQKQAIIHHAVTRGLDPHVRLKPSGVEWLGDVPEHWELRRLKSVARIRYGLGQPPRESVEGLPLIRATNIERGSIAADDLLRVDPSDVPSARDAFLREGEIIVVRSGAYTADSAIIPEHFAGSVAGYDMVLSPRSVHAGFLAVALLSKYLRDDQLVVSSLRAAQPHLNAEELGAALLVLPPMSEQTRIHAVVGNSVHGAHLAIAACRKEIGLLRDYHTRLIADVVTGKLDVREAAARLPDEIDDEEPLDNPEQEIADPEAAAYYTEDASEAFEA